MPGEKMELTGWRTHSAGKRLEKLGTHAKSVLHGL